MTNQKPPRPASQKLGKSTKGAEALKAYRIRKGQVLNPWGCKGKDGTITDLITKQARAIAAERVKTESGASTTLLDAAIRKLVQLGLVQGDVQALTAFLDLVRGHKLKSDVALSGSLNVALMSLSESAALMNGRTIPKAGE